MSKSHSLASVGLLLSFCALGGVLSDVETAISQKRYLTAYELLQKHDPKNVDPKIFAKKVDVALSYYATCIQNEMFAFKDLAKDETIESVRGKPGSYTMHRLNVGEVAPQLIAKHPKDGNLHRVLGNYFYHGAEICGLDASLREKALGHYQSAKKLGAADSESLHNLGVLLLEKRKLKEGLRELDASLKLNDKFASTHYNIAFASLLLKNPKRVATHAERAFELYTDKKLKSEAALLASFGFLDSKNRAQALKFAELANQHKHENHYYILAKLLTIYIEMKELPKAMKTADDLFALQPTNPQLPQDVMKSYDAGRAGKEVEPFFSRNLAKYQASDEALGNLLFHRATYVASQGKKKQAIDDFGAARAHFQKALKPDHPVFQTIDAELAELKAGKP